MGKQGWNVNQARQLPGIISVDFDDYNSTFTIKAEVSTPVSSLLYPAFFFFLFKTKEAAYEARTMIEFTREIIHIPRDLAGKVIGRGGNVIQQVLEKSRLNNIKVIGDDEAQDRNIHSKGDVSVRSAIIVDVYLNFMIRFLLSCLAEGRPLKMPN